MGALQQVNLDTIQCERMYFFFLFLNKTYNIRLQNILWRFKLIRIYYSKKIF